MALFSVHLSILIYIYILHLFPRLVLHPIISTPWLLHNMNEKQIKGMISWKIARPDFNSLLNRSGEWVSVILWPRNKSSVLQRTLNIWKYRPLDLIFINPKLGNYTQTWGKFGLFLIFSKVTNPRASWMPVYSWLNVWIEPSMGFSVGTRPDGSCNSLSIHPNVIWFVLIVLP